MSKELLIRRPYDQHVRVTTDFHLVDTETGELVPMLSRTKQSFKDECDVNFIMAKYERTGIIDHRNEYQGSYGEFFGVEDYQTSLNRILAADQAFNSLPARIRKRFGNDPAAFLEFATDEANSEEMIEMGLRNPPEPDRVASGDGGSREGPLEPTTPQDPPEPA